MSSRWSILRQYLQNRGGGTAPEEPKLSREQQLEALERQSMRGVRFYIVLGVIFALLSIVIVFRIIQIATVQADSWQKLAKNQILDPEPSPPTRGNIYSDEKIPLAISVPRYTMRIDFQADRFNDSIFLAHVDSLALKLSNLIGDKSAKAYRASLMSGFNKKSRSTKLVDREVTHLERNEINSWSYLKRQCILGTSKYNNPGITVHPKERVIRRIRPYQSLAARTIGGLQTDPDSLGITHGNSGLEMRFDPLLCGKPGLDRLVRIPPRFERIPIIPAEHGMHVYTTLNIDIQDITERALRKALIESNAHWGCAVVMEVKSGAIKAISNLDRIREGVYMESTNHALADLIEPGSTFKVISMMAALETGRISHTDTVDVGNGVYRYARGLTIRDWNAHHGGYGKLTRDEVIYNSSNIGTALSVLEAFGQDRRQEYLDALNAMNVFDQIDLEIPGTAKPRFKQDVSTWSMSTMPWSSYGYEIQMPPIYTLRLYNAIANKGKMMQPFLVSEVSSDDGHVGYQRKPEVVNSQIVSRKTLKLIQSMLRGVVTEGTAKRMDSPFVEISGKTGTALISSGGGYEGRANVTFCGYFPSQDPLYSCIVVVGRPNVNSSGIPGGVLREIAEQSIATNRYRPLSEMHPDSTATFNMRIDAGYKEGVKEAIQKTKAKPDRWDKRAEWTKHEGGDSLQILKELIVIDNVMPDFCGMSAMDALYLAEQLGLKVYLSGSGGTVTKQSRKAGGALRRGEVLTLQLAK